MNANKLTAIGTAILAIIGFFTIGYQFHKDGMRKIDEHSALEGHPKLVSQNIATRELLDEKIKNIESTMASMLLEIKEMKAEMKEMRACMHRIELGQSK